ncbi:MAG: PQQ-binding-like beta-propeller repeat protein, partial [Pseudomonadota bacterium]
GEIHALDSSSGQSIWNDTLIVPNRTAASGTFSGIGGNPIIKDDVVYVGGSGGIFAALSLPNGRRIWEQDIATLNTPWVADDFIYVLSSDNNLVCLNRADGRIKWTKQIASYDNPEKHKNPYSWRGPIMANGELLIAGKHGKMLVISPQDGSDIKTVDIPENITDAPIIVAGKLYVLTANAKLHVIY